MLVECSIIIERGPYLYWDQDKALKAIKANNKPPINLYKVKKPNRQPQKHKKPGKSVIRLHKKVNRTIRAGKVIPLVIPSQVYCLESFERVLIITSNTSSKTPLPNNNNRGVYPNKPSHIISLVFVCLYKKCHKKYLNASV